MAAIRGRVLSHGPPWNLVKAGTVKLDRVGSFSRLATRSQSRTGGAARPDVDYCPAITPSVIRGRNVQAPRPPDARDGV